MTDDLVSVNSFGLNGMGLEAIELFKKTPVNLLDNVTYICVLNACSHSGLVKQAEKIFEEIPMDQRTEHVYTAMVNNFSYRRLQKFYFE